MSFDAGHRTLAALLLAAAVAAQACSDRDEHAASSAPGWTRDAPTGIPESERYGGTIVVAGRNDLQSMNALVSSDFESAQHQIYVLFVTLVRNTPGFEPAAYLARSWELEPASGELVFHLRDDLVWHDGVPVTARDVAFTFERAKDPRVPFANPAYFDLWEEVEVVDDHTIRFIVRPQADLLYGWSRTAIMPAHLLGSVPVEELPADAFGTVRPVGAGPFRFVERVPGDRWVFEANPDYPPGLGGRPYADRLVYRRIPDDGTLVAALRAGEVDLVIDATPAMLERVASDSSILPVAYPAPDYNFVAWNSRRAGFGDRLVRRALTMAIDRQALVEAFRGGYGTIAAGPVGPWHWAYDTAWRPLPFDPDSSASLLEGRGWRDTDGDGVRDRAGEPFRFELLSTPRREWRDVATVIQSNLAAVGVAAMPTVLEQSALIPRVTGPDRRFDAVLLGWARDVPLDDRDLWACDQVGQPVQFTSYCNPELDRVLDSIRVNADRARLRRFIGRYQGIIAADQPYTFLYYVDRVDLRRARLRSVEMDARGDWVGVTKWWLHPAARRPGDRP